MKNKYIKVLLKYKAIILVIIVLALLITMFVMNRKHQKEVEDIKAAHQQQVAELNSQIAANSRTGYVALTDIYQGDILQDGVNVSLTPFIAGADQSIYATADCLGKQAVVSIPVGTPITNNVIAPSTVEQLNERECTFIHLSANLLKGDFVDVRILFPNGESYIIVSKVSIQNPVILSNLVYLWMTEDEITRLDAAIVDANLHGAIIYTTKYIVPEIEPANIVTYQPNAAVISAMTNNPNIVQQAAEALSIQAREGIESRLKAFEEAYPNFELDTIIDSDISQALESINAANGTTGTTEATDGISNTTQDTTGTATDTGVSAGGTPDASGSAGGASTTGDTTVTYGN